ncbi:MAG: protein-L-isoaspartate O-methyltransferase [Rhizobiaceae bacterium]
MNVEFSQQRVKMVDGQLRTTDVTSLPILDAMGAVPRELFVHEARRPLAYLDDDLEVAPARNGAGPRYLMEPSPFAKLLQLAEIRPTDSVLDVGTATGYSAAILSRLAASVVALESDVELADAASAHLRQAGAENVTVVKGPLAAGHAAAGPYDVIVVEGAVGEMPQALFDQLKEGGRLVAVEGYGHAGTARLYLKANGVVAGRRAFNAAVKPLPGFEKNPQFEF